MILLAGGCTTLREYEFVHPQMGTYFRLVLFADDEASAKAAADAAFARIDQLNGVFSDYDPDSELSRLGRAEPGQPVKLSADLLGVLRESEKYWRLSDGTFDVTVGPLVQLWRWSRRNGQLPAPARLDAARRSVGFDKLAFDPSDRTVTLMAPDMRLDLGGIAVGYTIDDVGAMLRARGLSRFLLDGGGDILLGDPPPGKEGWRIGIVQLTEGKDAPPSRYITLHNAAITTSGDAFRFIEIEGRRYSHIVDIKTGLGLTERGSVTVIAPTCTAADALATTISLLGAQKGIALADRIEGVAAIVVRMQGDAVEVLESQRVKELRIDLHKEE
jgi:thiamine biosynthesis lipoprotein